MQTTPGVRFGRGEIDKPFRPETTANDPRDIRIDPAWNVRDMNSQETREWIEALKVAILSAGYDQTKPITVKYDRALGVKTLVDGQCRLTACQQLWDEGHEIYVPEIRTDGDEADLTALSLSSNAGRPLTQWEIGSGCRRLQSYGWTKERIAAHICKSVRYVSEAVALSNTPIEVKSMLSNGDITPGAALHAVKEHGPDAAAEVLKAEIAAQPSPPPTAQASFPGTAKPVKPKPLARPKEKSKREKALEQVPVAPPANRPAGELYTLAIDLARGVIADDKPFEQMERLAYSVLQAAGLKK